MSTSRTRGLLALTMTAWFCWMSGPALAAQTAHSGVVEQMQLDASVYAGREHVVWVRMLGAWSGTTCAADWAWFNSEDDPQIMATLLSARLTATSASVYVDDTLPKISGYCQIISMTM